MRGRIGGRVQCSIELVAIEVEQDDLFGSEVFVSNAAWLDGHDAGGAVYCADIAPAIYDEVVAGKLDIRIADGFSELVVHNQDCVKYRFLS